MSETKVASDGEMVNEMDGTMEGDSGSRAARAGDVARDRLLLSPAFAV